MEDRNAHGFCTYVLSGEDQHTLVWDNLGWHLGCSTYERSEVSPFNSPSLSFLICKAK